MANFTLGWVLSALWDVVSSILGWIWTSAKLFARFWIHILVIPLVSCLFLFINFFAQQGWACIYMVEQWAATEIYGVVGTEFGVPAYEANTAFWNAMEMVNSFVPLYECLGLMFPIFLIKTIAFTYRIAKEWVPFAAGS